MNHVFRTRVRGSDTYKYVSLFEFIRNGEKCLQWVAVMPKGYGGCTSYHPTERDAAIFVDNKLISIGRKPVNILVKK